MDGLHAFLSVAYENNLAKFNKIRETGVDYCPMNFLKFAEFSEKLLDEQALQTTLSVFDLLPKFQEVIVLRFSTICKAQSPLVGTKYCRKGFRGRKRFVISRAGAICSQ